MSEHELWNELGKIYFDTGAYDSAIHAYTRAIELSPDFGLPYSNLALAYVQKGKYPEALSFYRKSIGLLQNNKARAIAWNRLGDMYRQLKDYDNAVLAFRKADELDLDLILFDDMHEPIETDPDPKDVLVIRNDQDTAESKASITQDDPGISPESTPDGHTPSADGSVDNKASNSQAASLDPDGLAIEFIEGDVEPNIEGEDVYLEPALFAVNPEESQWQALEDPENFIQGEEPSLEPDANGGESGEPLETVVSDGPEMLIAQIPNQLDTRPLVPTDLPVYSDQEQELRLAGIFPEDIPNPDPVASVETEEDPLRADVTVSNEVMQETHASRSALAQEELAELNRDITNMKRVLEINPRNAFGWDSLGKLYKSAGQYDEAITAYERAIELDPSKSFYHYNLGLVFAAKKEFEKAIEIFHHVLELNPDYGLAHATIAGCYRRLGREEEAQKHIKIAAISIQEENEYNLACFEAICGNVDHSIELLQASLARNQVSLEWVLRDPDLDFVRDDPRFEELVGIR